MTHIIKHIFISLVVIALGILTYFYLINNQEDFIGDEPGHLSLSVEFLKDPSLFLLSCRPPLQFFSTSMFYRLFGPSKTTAVLSNLIWIYILIYSTFLIGKEIQNKQAGILAVMILLSFPMTLGMTRMNMTEVSEIAMVAASILALIKSEKFSKRIPSTIFGICIGLGILTKGAYPVFIIGPLIIVFSTEAFIKPRRSTQFSNIGLSLIIGCIIGSLWFTPKKFFIRFSALQDFSFAPANNLEMGYLKGLILYLYSLIDFSLSYIGYLIIPSFAMALIMRQDKHKILLSWMIVPVLILNLFPWRTARYLFPILPSIALLISIWLTNIKSRSLRQISVIFLLIWLIFVLVVFSIPWQNTKKDDWLVETSFHQKLFANMNISPDNYREDFWIRSPSKRSFHFQKVVDFIHRENTKRKDTLKNCYILLNNSYQGPIQLTNGEFIDHPLSWPFKAFVDLNNLNLSVIPIYMRGENIYYWHPDEKIEPLINVDQAFVIMFPTVFYFKFENIIMLSFIGEVNSLNYPVRIYITPGAKLPSN